MRGTTRQGFPFLIAVTVLPVVGIDGGAGDVGRDILMAGGAGPKKKEDESQ